MVALAGGPVYAFSMLGVAECRGLCRREMPCRESPVAERLAGALDIR
jgi:hypothetical protein